VCDGHVTTYHHKVWGAASVRTKVRTLGSRTTHVGPHVPLRHPKGPKKGWRGGGGRLGSTTIGGMEVPSRPRHSEAMAGQWPSGWGESAHRRRCAGRRADWIRAVWLACGGIGRKEVWERFLTSRVTFPTAKVVISWLLPLGRRPAHWCVMVMLQLIITRCGAQRACAQRSGVWLACGGIGRKEVWERLLTSRVTFPTAKVVISWLLPLGRRPAHWCVMVMLQLIITRCGAQRACAQRSGLLGPEPPMLALTCL
jgi:hypothetical protein